jgi:hypothetical protein
VSRTTEKVNKVLVDLYRELMIAADKRIGNQAELIEIQQELLLRKTERIMELEQLIDSLPLE